MSSPPAMSEIKENVWHASWNELLARRPDQDNRLDETDAELVPSGDDELLALTTDTVAEEIAVGLYREPETVGWVGATAALSDLAAVGARPLGLVAAVALPRRAARSWQQGIGRGLAAACRGAGTFVLGGDTSFAETPSVTCSALGRVRRGEALRRLGCVPGEIVYVTGPLGAGSLLAARVLQGERAERGFRPRARLAEARRLAGYARCCMDTSDGLIATLDQLMRLNGVGFELRTPLEALLCAEARALCVGAGLPPLAMLAGQHGEFELVVTVRAADRRAFEAHLSDDGLRLLEIGRTIETPVIRVGGPAPRVIDSTRIRNLLDQSATDLPSYAAALVELCR